MLGDITISFKFKSCVILTLATNALAAVTLLSTFTLLFGISTLCVLSTARSSKSALLEVVVIKLSSINISSNCACLVISIFCVIVKLPVTPALPPMPALEITFPK